MAESNQFVLNEPTIKRQNTDTVGLHSAVKASKGKNSDSLQKLLQNTTLPHGQLGWSHSNPCTTPQNLFLEGFKDCASEVIRFLTEHEHVEDNNPLLIGLESHLMNVSKTICHETINDVDSYETDIEAQKNEAFVRSKVISNDNERLNIQMTNFSPCSLSPIISRSANSSVSDSSTEDSDFSMSISSTFERSSQSVSFEANSSLHCASMGNTNQIFTDHNRIDDVFYNPSSHYHISSQYSVMSLRHLSMNALQNAIHHGHIQAEAHRSPSRTLFSSPCIETNTDYSLTAGFSPQVLPLLNQSSPIIDSPTQCFTFSENSCNQPQCFCTTSKPERCNISQSPTVSTMSQLFSFNLHPDSTLPQQTYTFLHRNAQSDAQSSLQHLVPLDSQSISESQIHSDFSQHINSILQLKGNLLPGMESSMVASESFADILLAVESCRLHEDPRVRALAEELVHLIRNDEYDDEEDGLSYDEEDEAENMYNANGESGFESGIEMMDESADWGNVVDIIEQ